MVVEANPDPVDQTCRAPAPEVAVAAAVHALLPRAAERRPTTVLVVSGAGTLPRLHRHLKRLCDVRVDTATDLCAALRAAAQQPDILVAGPAAAQYIGPKDAAALPGHVVVVCAAPAPTIFASAAVEAEVRHRAAALIPAALFTPSEALKCASSTHPLLLDAFRAALAREDTLAFIKQCRKKSDEPALRCWDALRCASLPAQFDAWLQDPASVQEVDVAIVGAGVAGTACAFYLSKNAAAGIVGLYEQSQVPNAAASSQGDSRFYREMYSDPFYSRMMTRSLALWREVEAEGGRADAPLLSKKGVLFFGSADSGETAEGSLPGCKTTMDALGMPYDFLNSQQELNSRFPGLHANPGDIGLFSLNDGSIHATEACKAMSRAAMQRGVDVVENATLLEVVKDPCVEEITRCGGPDEAGTSKFLLYFSDGRVVRVRSKLVLTTGAWTSHLLREEFDVEIEAAVQLVAWGHFELPDEAPDPPQWFCFRKTTETELPMGADQHGLYYGFPAVPAPPGSRTRRMVKVGTDFTPDCVDSSESHMNLSHRSVPEELRKDIREFLKKHWPAFGDVVNLQLSPYHMTPSQDFVLGDVPSHPDLFVFCGGSGRAFKFGPLVGACLADLVLGNKSHFDISRFDPARVVKKTHSVKAANGTNGRQKTDDGEGEQEGHGMLGKSHVPFGEQGEGVYSLATQGCFDVVRSLSALVLEAANKLMSEPGEGMGQSQNPLVLADFGAADGGTSLNIWTELIAQVHARDPEREIDLRYEDQPNADFQSLFAYTQGRLRVPGRSGRTFLEGKHADKVFVSAIGTSFHKQCLPSCSLHLGLSATAMHWLSKVPSIPLPRGVVHHTGAPKDGPAAEAWAAQARDDWDAILSARAAELAVGGRLIIANFCVDEAGQFLGRTDAVPRSMYDEMQAQWEGLLGRGRISETEFGRATIVNYYRSVAETCAPLEDESSRAWKLGLRLEHVHTGVTPCPYRAKWLGVRGDPKEYSKLLVMTMRTWSNSSFKVALDESRSEEERMAICDELYDGVAEAVAVHPDDYGMDYVHAYLVLRKV